MPQREIDSLSSDGAQLVASLLARIDRLMAQIAARDERIDELLAQVKALNARIAELESKRGGPPKTPDNSFTRKIRELSYVCLGYEPGKDAAYEGVLRACEAHIFH